VSESIIIAVARLVDDAQSERRDPSHSDITFAIDRAGLRRGDPNSQGQTVGKAKRVRSTLSWALENAPNESEILVASLIAFIRTNGGFRETSPNFVGKEAIINAIEAFRTEGYSLSTDGELLPISIDTLSGLQLTEALEAYVRRARRGNEDAALLVGTGKDLLEATAAHVLTERYGNYSQSANFPTLLGQAFTSLGLATPADPPQEKDSPQQRLHRALYEAGCAVNVMRNKEGTGHGRPWLSTVSESDAHAAIQLIGVVSGFLLAEYKATP
jgi:hypothetical protein